MLERALRGETPDDGGFMGGGEGRSHTLQLRLWTDRGEVALSMTASVIGPEHEKQRPVAIYGQGK